MISIKKIVLPTCIVFISSFTFCFSGELDSVETVNIDINKYMGKWYEIARFPHRFEKNLSCVTATYTLNDDGTVTVLNEGFNIVKNKKSSITGKANILDKTKPGRLNVSFFFFIGSDYLVLEADKNDYSYALVSGGNRNYLWILARKPVLPIITYNKLVQKAESLGFDITKLEMVDHNCDK